MGAAEQPYRPADLGVAGELGGEGAPHQPRAGSDGGQPPQPAPVPVGILVVGIDGGVGPGIEGEDLELVHVCVAFRRGRGAGGGRWPRERRPRAPVVWQYRPIPSLSGPLAALPRTPGIRLPSASTGPLRQAEGGSFHPARIHGASWRTRRSWKRVWGSRSARSTAG